MSVKLVVLKSGENIITDIKEGVVGEKVVAYILDTPCLTCINGSFKMSDDEENSSKLSISLQPWPYLSSEKVVTIDFNWVVTIVEPNPELKKMYEKQVLNDGKHEHKVANFTEQSDSSDSN